MKIAITTAAPDLDAELDPRFGRGAYFLFIDTETMEWQAVPNPGVSARGGAGIQAAGLITAQKVAAVISGEFGPNAFRALQEAGVTMYQFNTCRTAREAFERFKAGELTQVGGSTRSDSHPAGQAAP